MPVDRLQCRCREEHWGGRGTGDLFLDEQRKAFAELKLSMRKLINIMKKNEQAREKCIRGPRTVELFEGFFPLLP